MVTRRFLGVSDYVVICLFLLISASIGIITKFTSNQQKNATGYLLAGRTMSKIPVILSIVVTMTSPYAMLSIPAEVYKYGIPFAIGNFAQPLGMFMASWIFIPVYFQCGVSTVNEYLEMRFGKMIKFITSVMFLLQMLFYMVVSLFGAVLALSAVSNLSMETSIVALGTICTIYCSLGGLKAVLWTDVFQAFLVSICICLLYITGIGDGGGVSIIYQRAHAGHRFDFDFTLDFTKRFGFWAVIFHKIMFGFGFYGTNQIEVQRILSLSNISRAKSALQLSSIPAIILYLACYIFGIVLYSVYYLCDPILNKDQTGIHRYDMIVPGYIVNRFSSIPGVTGLCIAGIFSASLSTISSALNSAATVTVVDLIKPLYGNEKINDTKTVFLAKLLTVIYGGLSIVLTFCFLEARSLVQLLNVMNHSLQGPMLAVFITGVLTRKANDKIVTFALLIGYSLMACLSFGALFSKYNEEPLPLSTSMCPNHNNTSHVNRTRENCNGNSNHECLSEKLLNQNPKLDTFILYRISFLWYAFIGFTLTSTLIFLAVLLTGWQNNISSDSKCLSPVTRLWLKKKNKPHVESVEIELKDGKNEKFLPSKQALLYSYE